MARIYKIILACLIGFSLAATFNANAWQGPTIGGGGGSFNGPASSTDNAFIRWDGTTGQIAKDSIILGNDAGVVSGITGLSMSGLQTFIGGTAITAGSYQMGRDADATNQLHFNVPTGASFEWSVNDVAEFSLNGTTANYQNNDLITTGRVAFGSDAIIASDRAFDLSHTVTDFAHENVYGLRSEIILEPAADILVSNNQFLIAGHEYGLTIPASNTHAIDVYDFAAANYFWHNDGSGDVSIGMAMRGSSYNTSSGDITFEMVGGYFTSINLGSGSISGTDPKAGNFGVATQTGTLDGPIARDYSFYAESPFATGTIDKHWGLYLEDQEFGTESWAIETTGGKIQFGSPTGKDQYILLTDGDVAQPFSSFGLNTQTTALSGPISSTGGGLKTIGISDSDSRPLEFDAYYGTTDPTDANEAIRFTAAKHDGAGGVAALGASEAVLRLNNNISKVLNILGSGNTSFGPNDPNYSLDVNRSIGSDASFGLLDGDVTQPVTSLHPTNAFFNIKPFSSTAGGAFITGLSDGDAPALTFHGYIGTGSPTDVSAPFRFVGAKTNGTTGIQNVSNGEILFEFINNSLTSQPAFMCRGNRACGFSTQYPNARLEISSSGSDSSSQSFQITDSGSGNQMFRVRNDQHVTIGNPTTGQNAFLNVNAPSSAGASAEAININSTLAAMDGSDNYTGLEINITSANHTGTGNTIYGINIPSITSDADETASAIIVGGTGWDYGLVLPTNIGIKLGDATIIFGGSSISINTPVELSSSLTIGSGNAISKHISVNQTNVTSASISAASCADYGVIAVTGADLGDSVTATPNGDTSASGIEESSLSWNAYVSSANTVTIRACNPTALAIDNGNDQTWRVDVWKH